MDILGCVLSLGRIHFPVHFTDFTLQAHSLLSCFMLDSLRFSLRPKNLRLHLSFQKLWRLDVRTDDSGRVNYLVVRQDLESEGDGRCQEGAEGSYLDEHVYRLCQDLVLIGQGGELAGKGIEVLTDRGGIGILACHEANSLAQLAQADQTFVASVAV
jgi:hypothetical protein